MAYDPTADPAQPLLLDGALGTQFANSGFDLERDLEGYADAWEVLSLTRPEQVRAVHESYLDAGADFIGTHTFMVLPSALAARGLADRLERLVSAATREARAAIDAWSTPERPRGVIGVLGPGLDLPSRGGRSAAAVEDEYAAAGRLLDRAEVDLLLLETCADPLQIEAAARGLRSASDRSLWISLATIDGQLLSDFSLEEAVSAAREAGAELLGLNCGTGPDNAALALERTRDLWSGPLGFWPSASADGSAGDPLAFAHSVAESTRRFDLRAVGGCCGSGPAHIRHLAAELGLAGPEDDWYDEVEDEAEDESDGE